MDWAVIENGKHHEIEVGVKPLPQGSSQSFKIKTAKQKGDWIGKNQKHKNGIFAAKTVNRNGMDW